MDSEKGNHKLKREDAIAALQKFAGTTAHDYNNVLTPILGFGRMLSEQITDEEQLADLHELIIAAERGAALCSRYSQIAQFRDPETTPVELCSFLRSAEGILNAKLGAGMSLDWDLPDVRVGVGIDAQQFLLVLDHLATNSSQAIPDGGVFQLQLSPAESIQDHDELEPGDYVKLTIKDDGPGFPSKILENVGRPFQTTRPPTEKLAGLGLPLCLFAVTSWGGTMEIDNKSDGASVHLFLPAVLVPDQSEPEKNMHMGEGLKVFIAEEDDDARRALVSILQGAAYEIEEDAGAEGIHLAMIELGHPGESEHIQDLREHSPEAKLLRMAVGMTGASFVTKPVDKEKLLAKLSTI